MYYHFLKTNVWPEKKNQNPKFLQMCPYWQYFLNTYQKVRFHLWGCMSMPLQSLLFQSFSQWLPSSPSSLKPDLPVNLITRQGIICPYPSEFESAPSCRPAQGPVWYVFMWSFSSFQSPCVHGDLCEEISKGSAWDSSKNSRDARTSPTQGQLYTSPRQGSWEPHRAKVT